MNKRQNNNSMKRELNVVNFMRFMTISTKPSFIDSPPYEKTRSVLESIVNWDGWTDSSRKSDPPPDFYNESGRLMMEVMRVSHEQYVDEKGHPHDPSAASVSAFIRDISDLDGPGVEQFFECNTVIEARNDTDRPRFCGYPQYLESFSRVVGAHISRIPNYRKNHPGFRLIFLIYDESGPFRVMGGNGDSEDSTVYYDPIFDERIQKTLREADIDLVIWFCPYMVLPEGPVVPPITIFDPKLPIRTKNYAADKVRCVYDPNGQNGVFFLWWSKNEEGLLQPNVFIGRSDQNDG